MLIRPISQNDQERYDRTVRHPLQSFAWGSFRAKTGAWTERIGIFEGNQLAEAFSITFHPVPKTKFTVGYFPKGNMPTEAMLRALSDVGKQHNALYIKLEPNVLAPIDKPDAHQEIANFLLAHDCVYGRPLFTKYTFVTSLAGTEEDMLARMRPKTRYNLRLAEKRGVTIVEDSTQNGLQEYLSVLKETTKRQQFYAHNEEYFKTMWRELEPTGMMHIFKAVYSGKTLSVWIVFLFNSVLYYPYGASSRDHKDVMANNLLCFEVMKWGKVNGATTFDMWGSLGPQPDPKDPWYGFHRFKEGYGGTLMESVGSFDYVLNPQMYKLFRIVEDWRWKFLRLKARFGR